MKQKIKQSRKKINKTENLFFENINKIYNFSNQTEQSKKKKKRRTQITNYYE